MSCLSADCQLGVLFYGPNCVTPCTCVAANTQACDKISGACTCKTGWTDGTCSTDINECTVPSHTCTATHEQCRNTAGAFRCACVDGYVKNSEGICQGKKP